MELTKTTIGKALKRLGHPNSDRNISTIQDALQWEDREDYDTLQDLLDSIIEDQEPQLRKS